MTNIQPWMPTIHAVLLLALIVVIQVSILYVNQSADRKPIRKPSPSTVNSTIMENNKISQNKSETLKILWYNLPFYLKPHVKLFRSKPCTCKCSVSTDARDLAKSDVVVFTQSFMPHTPPPKEKHHIWCFNTMENRALTSNPGPLWLNKFEWIMSYRRDSDISRPYGIIRKRANPIRRHYSKVFRKKTKEGVWMSGHCPVASRRKTYIQELKQFMKIDMFGRCGKRQCLNKSPYVGPCIRNFSRDYKFYFSFENNICKDYTTEKLFNFFSNEDLNIIPVIRGPSTVNEYLPKGTYINAFDFSSKKELAKRLKEISSNETEYIMFLKEKDKYYSLTEPEVFREVMCNICEKINRGGREIPTKANYWDFHFKNSC